MSETEFGRLMDEVTAQPPVDVAFAAVADRVHRRQTRLRTSAVVASVAALAVIIAVPAAFKSGGGHGIAIKPRPVQHSAATATETPAASSAAPRLSASSPVAGVLEQDGVRLGLPAGWKAVTVDALHASLPPDAQVPLAMFSDQPMSSECTRPDEGLDCMLSLGNASVLALVTGAESDNIEGDTGQFGPVNDDGTLSAADGRCPARAGYWWTWQHLYGLRSHGYVVQITACISENDLVATRARLTALTSALSVRYYPELGAGTATHAIVSSDSAYPGTVCTETLGAGSTSAAVTVAQVRDYATGPAAPSAPHAFSGLTPGQVAAWCWVRNASKHSADANAVYPGYAPLFMVRLGGQAAGAPLPTGMPSLP